MNFFKKFQKLSLKNQDDKKKIISFVVTIFGIFIILTGTSVAYLMSRVEGTENKIVAGSLVLSLSGEGTSLSLEGALPMNDTDGLAQENVHTFSLENTGSLRAYYEIKLINDCTVGTAITINGNSITPDACIPNEYIKAGVQKGTGEYEIKTISNNVFYSGYINNGETINFNLKLWLSSNTPNDYQGITSSGVTRNVIYNGQIGLYFEQTAGALGLDTSGANAPELVTGMIPVYYDSANDTWRKADSSNYNATHQWYSYTDKMWANAVTVTETNRTTYQSAAVGAAISMDDINTMWVWIPRFNAVTPSNYNGGTQTAPGAIDVTFVNNTTTALDAFTFGDQTLSGFWYGKFEVGHTTLASSTTDNNLGCSNETCSNANGLIIKPNVISLRYNSVSNFFYASRSMEQTGNAFGFNNTIDATLDTHMSKNNEWGAVAYLTQSIYGRCTSSTSCTEVTINNCSTYTTGIGADTINASYSSTTCTTAVNKYNGAKGILASTTGTIYGIYDMSGGAWEYVMGNYNNTTSSSGLASTWFTSNSKYYNLYTGTTFTGHALTETSGWYSDYASFVDSDYPWFLRGGYYNIGSNAGLFYFYFNNGYSYSHSSFRPAVVK